MPQPFSKGSWVMSWTSLQDRPELAKHIGYITSLWSHVEHEMGSTLAQMLATEARIAISMYLAVKSEPGRLAMMKEAANACLPEDQKKSFEKLIDKIGKVGKQRDLVVHGLWAIPNNKPDSLVWMDPRTSVKFNAAILSGNLGDGNVMRDHFDAFVEYQETDFKDIENRIMQVLGELAEFRRQLTRKSPKPNAVPPPSQAAAPSPDKGIP